MISCCTRIGWMGRTIRSAGTEGQSTHRGHLQFFLNMSPGYSTIKYLLSDTIMKETMLLVSLQSQSHTNMVSCSETSDALRCPVCQVCTHEVIVFIRSFVNFIPIFSISLAISGCSCSIPRHFSFVSSHAMQSFSATTVPVR